MSSSARFLLALSVGWAPAAQAACTALTENEVRAIAEQSANALLTDDTTTHRRGWGELQDGFPCLQAQLPKEAWASLLVSEAIVRNALGEDWLQPLDTALEAWPDAPGIPDFLREQYVARDPAQPVPHRLVRPGATLFVDGVLMARPPQLSGLHAVQLLENGYWTNLILVADPIPLAWLVSDEAPPPPPKPPITGRGSLSLAVGLSTVSQSVSVPGTFFGDTGQTGVLTGVTLIGVEPIPSAGGFAVGWDLRGAVQVASIATDASRERTFSPSPLPVPDGYLSVGWMGRGWAILGGAGASRSWVTTAEAIAPYVYPQPHLAVDIFSKRADFGFGGGATPSAAHLRMHGGSAVTAKDGFGLRFGVDASAVFAWFDEAPPGARTASVVSFGLGGTVGMGWDLGE